MFGQLIRGINIPFVSNDIWHNTVEQTNKTQKKTLDFFIAHQKMIRLLEFLGLIRLWNR